MAASIASGVCLLLILFAPAWAAAQGQPPGEQKKLVLKVEEAVKRALKVNDELKEAFAGVDVSRGKQAQAEAAKWAQLEANIFAGPSPVSELTKDGSTDGTIQSTSRVDDPVINGVFGRAQILLVQPLYTFGKITAFREAAGLGVQVSEAGVDKKASEVVLQVQQFYYGALLAGDVFGFLDGLREELERALRKAERQVEAGSPAATLSDVYQLRAFLAQAQTKMAEAETGRKLARDAIRAALKLEQGVDFELADKALEPAKVDIKAFEAYVQTARELRPEFVQLRHGIKAREALVQAAVADQYPIVYAAAVADIAQSTNRDESEIPIITDPLQHSQGGVILGLRWHFDFGITRGRIDEARAEQTKLIHKQDFADVGIPLQVRKAYLDLENAQQAIVTTEQAYRNARRWLVSAAANFDLGIGDVRELTDAFVSYSLFRVDNFRAIYNQRIALANLTFATGETVREFPARQ